MFHTIPSDVLDVMKTLEERYTQEKKDGVSDYERLRQIPAQTGRFLAMMIKLAPPGVLMEIGTSGGYSALWQLLALRDTGKKLITFEINPRKIELARRNFRQAGVADQVELVEGDVVELLDAYDDIAWCFLDTEKELYPACYDLVVPKLVPGGMLICDNAVSHAVELEAFLDKALTDPRLDVMVMPVGKGELVCMKI